MGNDKSGNDYAYTKKADEADCDKHELNKNRKVKKGTAYKCKKVGSHIIEHEACKKSRQ